MSVSEEDDFLEFDEPVDFTIEYPTSPDADEDVVSWQPPLVTNITANQVGESDVLVDQCGNRERRSPETASWQLTIEGLLLAPDVSVLRELSLANDEARFTTEIVEGVFAVDDIEITMEEGSPKGRFPNRPITQFTRQHAEERKALKEGLIFSFQIQTEEPDSNNNGGILG